MQVVEHRSVAVQRDMDLIRELLFKIEQNPQLDGTHFLAFDEIGEFGNHSVQEVTYHVELLFDAGLVKGNNKSDMPLVSSLTWAGHEFIADVSDPGIWSRVKTRIGDLPSVGLSIVAEIAKAELRKHLKLP